MSPRKRPPPPPPPPPKKLLLYVCVLCQAKISPSPEKPQVFEYPIDVSSFPSHLRFRQEKFLDSLLEKAGLDN